MSHQNQDSRHLFSLVVLTTLITLLMGGCASMNLGGTDPAATQETQAERDMTPAMRERMADGLASRGQNEVALTHYNKLLVADPENGPVRFKKAALLDRQGVLDTALSEYLEVIRRHPATPLAARSHQAAAMLLFKTGMRDEGAQHARKAVHANETLWRARMLLAVFHNYNERHEEAEAELKKALAYSPDNPEILNNLGMTYSMSSHPVESVMAFAEALRHSKPGAQENLIANNLGLALCRMGKYEEALAAFKRSGGGEAKALNNVGYYLYKSGSYAESLEYFEKAIAAAPRYYAKAADNLERAKLALRVQGAVRDAGSPPVPFASGEPEPAASTPLPKAEEPSAPTLQKPRTEPTVPATPAEGDLRSDVRNIGHVETPVLRAAVLAQPAAAPVYSVHVSSWRTEAYAQRHVTMLMAKGEKAWIGQADLGERGVWHRVYVGAFRSAGEAGTVCERLQSEAEIKDARVVRPDLLAPASTLHTAQAQMV